MNNNKKGFGMFLDNILYPFLLSYKYVIYKVIVLRTNAQRMLI